MRGSKPAARTSGGYTKRAKQVLQERAAIPKPVRPQAPKPKPLPPGMYEAVCAKYDFGKLLKTMHKEPFVISVDAVDNKWVLTVRGVDPIVEDFNGYVVRYAQSKFVRNPFSRQRLMS